MKQTLTINLGGVAFTIDDDAYGVLKDYLQKIEEHFPNPDDREIMSDIETRISELFAERLGKQRQVVDMDDVRYVMDTLGTPEQFGEDDEDGTTTAGEKDTKTEKAEKRKHRKFYRDTDNQILGGVASGIAAYLGWDVTLVRLLLIIILILGFGYIVPAYLIVWLIAPEARTTSQKLEMKGMEPSIENIRKYVESEQFKSSASRIGTRLGQIFLWIFRFVAIIVGITMASGGILVVGAIIYALIAALIGGSFAVVNTFIPFIHFTPSMFAAVAISALLCLIIPIVAIIGSTIRLLRRDKNPFEQRHTRWGWIWFAVWIISVITFIVTLSISANGLHRIFDDDYYVYDNTFDVTEKYLVGAEFDNLMVSNGIRVELVHDSIGYVEVKGTEAALRNTSAEIQDGTLTITLKANSGTTGVLRPHLPFVTVHYTGLNSISASSAASVTNREAEALRSDRLSVSTSSAAKVDLNVGCRAVDLNTTSASKIELDGKTDRLRIMSTSASKVDADDLNAGYANVHTTSGAVVQITADTINASATSGGFIEYSGTPVVENINSTSGGRISKDK